MAEHLTITIHPAPHKAEELTVKDALQQVLDLVELVERADAAGSDDVEIVWRLKSATTNSPITFQLEGTSSDPSVSVALRAASAKQAFEEGMNGLLRQGRRAEWMGIPALKAAKRVFNRNVNGIGRTDIRLDDAPEGAVIMIIPQIAHQGALVIERAILDEEQEAPNLSRTEYGSVEGDIISATTYYSRPALVLKERLSNGKVTCVLESGSADHIGPNHSWTEVWNGRRVLVGGALRYNAEGRIERIDAETLEVIEGRNITLDEIRALDVTGGMDPVSYLNMIRDADNG